MPSGRLIAMPSASAASVSSRCAARIAGEQRELVAHVGRGSARRRRLHLRELTQRRCKERADVVGRRGRVSSTGVPSCSMRPSFRTAMRSPISTASDHVVGHEDRSQREPARDREKRLLQSLARQGIERAERLVEEQHVRTGRERARDADALLLAPESEAGMRSRYAAGSSSIIVKSSSTRPAMRSAGQPSRRGVMPTFSAP
jgi:hypothetical protein